MAWGARQPHENAVATLPKQAQYAVHLSNSNGNYEACRSLRSKTKYSTVLYTGFVRTLVERSTKEPPGRHADAREICKKWTRIENRVYVRVILHDSEHSQTYRSLPQCLPRQQRHDSVGYDCCLLSSTDEGNGGVLREFS